MTYGGSGDELFNDMIPTGGGGYLAIGYTTSFGSGASDLWLVKLDSSGDITWQKAYGGPAYEVGTWAATTGGTGYIVSGATASFGAGSRDLWALKLDSSGNILWQKTYGGPGDESYPRIIPTQDGGYAFLGQTNSFGAGGTDFWLLKLDSSGNVIWQKTYGGAGLDSPNPVYPTAGGGYIAGGFTQSFGHGGYDAWVWKVDANGEMAVCPAPAVTTATAANSAATVALTSITPGATTAVPGTTTVTPVSTTATALPGATACQDVFMPLIMR